MFPLMSENLAAGVQHVVAMRSDAVDMVAGPAEPAVTVRTGFILHVLLETVFGESLVFYMIGLVFFCGVLRHYFIIGFQIMFCKIMAN